MSFTLVGEPLIYYCFTGKIIVMTGYPYENGQKTEIIDLLNPNSKINCPALEADIPERNGLVGGLLEENLLICGGGIIYPDDERYFRKCYVIGRYNRTIIGRPLNFLQKFGEQSNKLPESSLLLFKFLNEKLCPNKIPTILFCKI